MEFGLGHLYEIADFVRAVREGRPAPVPGADGRHLMAVLKAAYASSRDGGEVAVPDGPPSYACDELAGSLLYQRLPA